MELRNLSGNIIGVITDDVMTDSFESSKSVQDIITTKPEQALRMVRLDSSALKKEFGTLSTSEQAKVKIASRLQDDVIILENISCGLIKKDIDYFKALFKKIIKYGKKIILIDKNSYLFLNCVDNIYVINKENIIMKTNDIYDDKLKEYISIPKIVDFVNKTSKLGVRINHYTELDELLKAIYRIKS